MHWHTIHQDHSRRWWLSGGSFELRGEVSTRWRSGFIATAGYGGQEDFAEATFAVPRLFLHLAFDTPFKWHRLRPFDGKYGESEALFGLRQVGGELRLLIGHDAMAGWHSTHGRGGAVGRWFRDIRRNHEVTLFRGDWILGRPRYTREILEDAIPVTVIVGQWDGDQYQGTARKERATWRRRFQTTTREDYDIAMAQGIPFPGKGENSWDCGDDAVFGFSGATIEGAIARVVTDVVERRGPNWRPSEAPV